MTTASCVESKRRYPMATIYVPVYFPYSCSVLPLWRSGALPSCENEEASGPETLRKGRVGRVGTFYSGSSKLSLQHILTYLPSYCKNNICGVWVVYPETVTFMQLSPKSSRIFTAYSSSVILLNWNCLLAALTLLRNNLWATL